MDWKKWLLGAIENDQAAEDLNRQAMQEEFQGRWNKARQTQQQSDERRRAADASRWAAATTNEDED